MAGLSAKDKKAVEAAAKAGGLSSSVAKNIASGGSGNVSSSSSKSTSSGSSSSGLSDADKQAVYNAAISGGLSPAQAAASSGYTPPSTTVTPTPSSPNAPTTPSGVITDNVTGNQYIMGPSGTYVPYTPNATPVPTAPVATPTPILPTTPTVPTTPTMVNGVDYAADARKALLKAEADYQAEAKKVHDTILGIQNGSIPLNSGEQAQIDGLKQQFQALINDQTLKNKGATGAAATRGYQSGAAEYDPTFNVRTIGAIMTAGANKIADLNTKMASSVAALTQAFHDSDIAAVKDAYAVYQDASEKRTDALQKVIDDTAAAIKEYQDKQEKVQDQVNTIAVQAAKNGAPSEVLNSIQSSTSLSEALSHAGDYVQEASGDLGDYLNYKHQKEALGDTPQSYEAWLKAKQAADDARDANKAYSSAYAAAKGKAAGEAAAYGIAGAPLKPLTEGQAKDFTYAQRAGQADPILDSLQETITTMSPSSFALQMQAAKTSVTAQYMSPEVRQFLQARYNFTLAVTRRESGAAIPESEYASADAIYIPQPGDDNQTLLQKAQARQTAISSFKSNVPDYDKRIAQTPSGLLDQAEMTAQETVIQYGKTNPAAQDAIKKMVEDGKPYTEIKTIIGI